MQRILRHDVLGGLLFLAFGGGTAVLSMGYRIGTPSEMGPGFFPALLALLLVLIGAGLTTSGLKGGNKVEVAQKELRALSAVLASVVAFGMLLLPLGLFPSLFVMTGLSSLGREGASFKRILAISAALCVFCWLVFVKALDMRLPLLPQHIPGLS